MEQQEDAGGNQAGGNDPDNLDSDSEDDDVLHVDEQQRAAQLRRQ